MFETQLYRIRNKRISDEIKEVKLIQFNGEEWYVKEFGEFGIILDNVLIDNDLGFLLEKYVSEQMELFPVKIRRKVTNEIWENYSALELFNELTLDDFDRNYFEGCKIFFFMEGFYITKELKNIIEIDFYKANKLEFDNQRPFIA